MAGERVWNRWSLAQLPVFVVPFVVWFVQAMGSGGADYRMRYQALHLDGLAYALIIAGPVALLFRRRAPVATLTAAMAVTICYLMRGYVFGPIFLSVIVAIGSAIIAGRRIATWWVVGVGFAVLNGLALLAPFGPFRLRGWSATHMLIMATWVLLVLTGAELVRIRAERAAEARRTRAEEERRQASEERLRIARELHDVLAHNISLINVQAGVALHLMDEHPEQVRTALTAIKTASREALSEVRSVLGILRQVDEHAPRSPTTGLDRLEELVSRARAAGITVRTRTDGEARPLPAEVDLAAFRIVQEALTNVTRHAGPGVTADVRVTYGDDALALHIEDDGRGAPGDLPGGGDGIAGMRERVAALGGEMSAGPRAGGRGFRVRAVLPLAERRARRRGRKGRPAEPDVPVPDAPPPDAPPPDAPATDVPATAGPRADAPAPDDAAGNAAMEEERD